MMQSGEYAVSLLAVTDCRLLSRGDWFFFLRCFFGLQGGFFFFFLLRPGTARLFFFLISGEDGEKVEAPSCVS